MYRKLVAGLAGFALLAAACGDDANDPDAATTEAADEPADESAEPADEPADEPAAQATVPQAIVSLSPTATEMLFAIGAGDQVIAVDEYSNYPPETADIPHDLSGFEPSIEAIAAFEPDLVVTDGSNDGLLAQLDTLSIGHWEGPAPMGFDGVYAQIEELGAVTGHEDEAADVVAEMQTEVADVKAALPELDEPLTYYHELDPTFYSVTSETFIGAVYAEVGLVNIADAVGEGNPYPQLNQEFIVSEDPDLIFLASTLCCGESAESVAARPGWGDLTAIANGGVIELDDDIASRWGPRIVDYLGAVGDAVATVVAADG